jgi:hypothetical protein
MPVTGAGGSMQGQSAPAPQGQIISSALQNALKLDQVRRTADTDEALRRQPRPTTGLAPATNAVGENVLVPGRLDNNGNQIKAPVDASVDRANKDIADASGLSDKLRQKKLQENVQNTDPVRDLVHGILSGRYSGTLNNILQGGQQQQQTDLQRPTLGNQPPAPSLFAKPANKADAAGSFGRQGAPWTMTAPDQAPIPEGAHGVQPQKFTTAAPSGQGPQYNNAEQDRKEKEALANESKGKTATTAPAAAAAPAPPPYKAPSISEMAKKSGKPLPDDVPDQDQTSYRWLNSKHYFGVLGGTMTGHEAIQAGIKYGKVNAADVQPLYAAAREEYDRQSRVPQAARPPATETPEETKPQSAAQPGKGQIQVSPYLREQRQWIADELAQKPQLRQRLINTVSHEQPSKGNAARVTESLFNRLNYLRANGQPNLTVEQYLATSPKSFYGPIRRGAVDRGMAAGANAGVINGDINAALAGSNFLRGMTDQGSRGDPNFGVGETIMANGEGYNDFGRGAARSWRVADQKQVADRGLESYDYNDPAHQTEGAPSGGGGGGAGSNTRYAANTQSPTAGSAGRGTPEQDARLAGLRRSSFWREFFGGNPMLGYEKAEAEQRLLNGWTDWDQKRSAIYDSMSPSQAASGIVGPGGALDAHKTLHGEAMAIQSERGQVHPGQTTQLSGGQRPYAGGAGATGATGSEAQAGTPAPAPQMTLSEQAALRQAQLANQYQVAAQRMMQGVNSSPASPYYQKGMEMMLQHNKAVGEADRNAAETGRINTARIREGILPYGNLGYFNLNEKDANGQPKFYSNAEVARGIAERLDREDQQRQQVAPEPTQGGTMFPPGAFVPSIGGTGAPSAPNAPAAPQGGAGTAPIPMPQQQTSGTQSKPIPASPAEEQEQRRQRPGAGPKEPFAGPDYLNSRDRAVPAPAPQELFRPGGPHSTYNRAGQDTSNKEGDNKIAQETVQRSNAASRMNVQLETILNEAAKLKPGESGPWAHERQEWIGKWRQFAANVENMTGVKLYQFDSNASVDTIKMMSLELAREIATGQGSTGRGAGVIMRMLIPHLPTAELPEEAPAQNAILKTAYALKAEVSRTQDYSREQNEWVRQGFPLGGFDDWFERAHPVMGYVGRAEIASARNEAGAPINNEVAGYLRSHP